MAWAKEGRINGIDNFPGTGVITEKMEIQHFSFIFQLWWLWKYISINKTKEFSCVFLLPDIAQMLPSCAKHTAAMDQAKLIPCGMLTLISHQQERSWLSPCLTSPSSWWGTGWPAWHGTEWMVKGRLETFLNSKSSNILKYLNDAWATKT